MKCRSLALSIALLCGSGFSLESVSLDGFVGNILGQPLPNVGVQMARGKLSTTTDAEGAWSLSGQVDAGVARRVGSAHSTSTHLRLVEGHVLLEFQGRSLLGRRWSTGDVTRFGGPNSESAIGARSLADSVAFDTLYFTWKGALVAKRAITAWNLSGLKQYIDTTGVVPTVVPGPSGVAIVHPIPLPDFARYTAGMVQIPARNRSFMMGLKDSVEFGDFMSYPQHRVSFSYDWFMDTTGVTVREFADVMTWAITNKYVSVVTESDGTRWIRSAMDSLVKIADLTSIIGSSNRYLAWNASKKQFEAVFSQNYPMVDVTWYGAAFFANMKSLRAGLEPVYSTKDWTIDYAKNGYRLPTDAEWEYSARAGTTSLYWWGESDANSDKFATNSYWSVGTLTGNPYGLYDMPGNGWDWCNDLGSLPGKATQVDPSGPAPNGTLYDSTRVLRGGNGILRSGERAYSDPGSPAGLRMLLPVR